MQLGKGTEDSFVIAKSYLRCGKNYFLELVPDEIFLGPIQEML